MSYDFDPTQRFESETLPGVSFTVRKMSEAERSSFRLMQADAHGRIQDLVDEVAQLAAVSSESRNSRRIATANREIDMILKNEVNHTWVKWGLESVDGLNVRGVPATTDHIATGTCPSEFYEEVLERIKKVAQMSDAEIKNYSSLSIFGAPVESATSDTTAESVSAPDISVPETAESISQV